MNLPVKVCRYEDNYLSGILDFANQNADRFLKRLEESGVNYYDLRNILHAEGMNHHEAFFRTDHHWRPESGLWAARKILELLRNNYNLDTNPETLNPENFEGIIYREWFLGSQGRKVTLLRTKPDDITLFYPKYKTLIDCEIPDMGINTSGDFTVMYDMKMIERKDYYKLSPYHAYSYGDRPLIKIVNHLTNNNRSLLLLHDSFCDCVIPFLAMGVRRVDAIDLRHFTGSLKTYMEYNKPDAVIISYHSGYPGTKDKTFLLH